MSEEDTSLSPSAEAAMYHTLSDMQFKDGSLLIDEVLKLQPGESILDLGCGTGGASMVLASRVGPSGRILGIPKEPSRSSSAGLGQVGNQTRLFHGRDVRRRNLQGSVRCHLQQLRSQDHGAVLQDAYKCLRSGGRFATFARIWRLPSNI